MEIETIVTERNEAAALQIAKIKNNTKNQIESLKLKYAIPDAIKTTSGFIAIISLGTLALLVVITDSLKYLFCKNKKPEVKKKMDIKIKPLLKYQMKA